MSSSPSSSTSPRWEHDVFASFRGPDQRLKFMAHLFRQLKEKKINYYYDQDPEHVGKDIEDIFGAIRHAKIVLVVFTESFVDSKWCLNELVEILDCRKHHKLKVFPIFYISVSEVKEWAKHSEFEQALKNFAGDERERCDKRRKWKNALENASRIGGFNLQNHARGDESELVRKIVQRLVKEINKIRTPYSAKDAIGVDHFADDVISLLNKDSKDGVRMVGICGPEGIGKKTVAELVFDRIRHQFEHSHFVPKIGKKKESERLKMREELFEKLGGEEGSSVIGDLTYKIKCRMRGKKILLVLDGVNDKKQVEEFGVGKHTRRGKMRMDAESRILITTRDRHLLTALLVDDKYIVNGLTQDNARQLLRCKAFETEEREQGQEKLDLSEKLTHYAGGHPLLLRALGSYVRNKPLDHWRTTLDKLARRSSSLFLPWQSVGQHEGEAGGAGAHDHATYAGAKRDFPNGYRTPIDSIEDIKLSSRSYPFNVVGPFGVVDGTNPWKDEGYTDVREIDVYVGSNPKAIKSISIIYDKYGRRSDRVQHGTAGNDKPYAIKLDYPSEYLTAISGYIGEDSGLTLLQSLTIITNVGSYGPYGTMKGNKFSFPYTGGKIVGFHGSCNGSNYLKSIGAFYKPIPHTYPVKIVEPFGSEGKKFWNVDNINGIDAHYEDFIMRIAFTVDNSTSSEPKSNYDVNGGENTFKVKLNDGECITSFAGYLENGNGSGTRINSLTFQTNKRILGPIGREKGKYFSLPSEAGKVTSFFVSSDDYLKSIRAKVEPYHPFESVGPFGWERGSTWGDPKQHINVRRIFVKLYSLGEDTFIRSIKFEDKEKNKISSQLETHGRRDGNALPDIELDEDEYLNSISGYMLQRSEETFGLTSLTFQTNKKTFKPIGVEKGTHFSSPTTGGKIVGFFGRSGEHLNAIGAQFQPISHLYPVKSIGPFGGTGGKDWDDGKFVGVKKISVMHNPDIHYIRFVYDKSGEEVQSQMHGCPTEGAIAKLGEFSLDYPREYLTSISGYKQEDGAIIQSLTFYTNKRKFGPFGEEKGKYFWYPSTGSRIIGFHGRCGKKLNAIGVYAEPVPCMYPFKTIGPYGSGGTPWDDGVHTDVRGFRISFGDGIHSIGIVYDNNGSFVDRSIHGGGDGPDCMKFWLDYPKERLVSISGWTWMDASRNTSQIRNLKIVTTKTTHGPFLPKSWSMKKLRVALGKLEPFTIPSDDGRIVGFFGSAGSRLNSIGARLERY